MSEASGPDTERPDRGRRKRQLQLGARIVGIGLLAYLLYANVDWNALVGQLAGLQVVWLLGLLVLASVDRILMPLKWRHLMRSLGPTPPRRVFLEAYYAASFLNYLIPSTLGGDVYRGYRLAMVADKHAVVASMVMERIVAVFSTIGYAWIGLSVLGVSAGSAQTETITFTLLAASGLLVAGFAMSLHPAVPKLLERVTARFRVARPLHKLAHAYAEFGTCKSRLFANFIFAVAENGLRLAVIVGSGMALGLQVPVYLLAAALAVSEFIRRASMVLDGWGLGTALHILVLGYIDVSVTDALAITLLSHAIIGSASLPGGLFLLLDRRQGIRISSARAAQ